MKLKKGGLIFLFNLSVNQFSNIHQSNKDKRNQG